MLVVNAASTTEKGDSLKIALNAYILPGLEPYISDILYDRGRMYLL